jgi:pSer/pThr/pTyr-binding forkhead associated (FHA) protein/outer membrane biosynthesis protein TonB
LKSPVIFRIFKDGQIQFVKQFIDKDQVVVGRAEANSSDIDIDLQSSDVSPIHCLIERRGLNFYLCDLGSIQGTFKNASQVLDEVLESGDEFQVGQYKIAFFIGVPKPVHAGDKSNEIIIPPPKMPPPKPTTPTKVSPPTKASAESAPSDTVSKSGWPSGTHSAIEKNPAKNSASSKPAESESSKVQSKVAAAPIKESKPEIVSDYKGQRATSPRAQQFLRGKRKKGTKTFAQPSHFQNLFQAVRPGQGGQIEILIAWNERILQSAHVPVGPTITVGARAKINLPQGTTARNFNLIETREGQTYINLPSETKNFVQRSDDRNEIKETSYKLQQNEVVFVSFANGIQLAIRFAPRTGLVPLDSPLIFSSSEFTGILAALIIAVLTSLIVSVMSPKLKQEEEEVQRIAQVIFDKPPVQIVAVPKPPEPPPQLDPPPPPPKAEIKPVIPPKIKESDLPQKVMTKGDPTKTESKSQPKITASPSANEVRANDSKSKQRTFRSSKSGAAIKTGQTAGANMKSKEPDVSNMGLLSAFGSSGVRQKLDKAYSGSGELLGAGEKATGASGFNESRAGSDLGNKFKDTGASGKGTATTGIAGVGTKGRAGTGLGALPEGNGIGTKEQTDIVAGGSEEEFVGTIDREAVRRAVRSSLNFFKACYEREYKKNTRLEGKVVISWEIHERGVAKNAKVVREKTTINNPALEECVRSRMLTLKFPEPPAGTVAEVAGYPFVFSGIK